MRLHSVLATGLASLALSACASSGTSSPASASVSSAADGAARWTGTFAPTQQRTGDFGGADRARTYGNVSLSSLPSDETRSRIRISVTVPSTAMNQALRWSILPGRCGSGSMPLIATNSLPPIEVGSNGRGELDAELAFATPSNGSYHVNVFWPGSGDQLENVMTCSNLRREG